jgi:sulfoquinovosyltransferase
VPGIEEMAWAALRFVHGRADLTLVTSPQMKEEMERNGIPRVDVWRKGIDTVRFHPKFRCPAIRERMSGGNPGDFLMVYVGRLGAEKRLKDLRPTLERCGPGARLCIVGTGPQEEELKAYFEGTDTVFTGQLKGDELSAAFASADAFVMPSDSGESFSFVLDNVRHCEERRGVVVGGGGGSTSVFIYSLTKNSPSHIISRIS